MKLYVCVCAYKKNLSRMLKNMYLFDIVSILQVCSWVTYLIMSQPTPQEQKAAFGCLLRAALSCWNIGNFNGAMEITTGLR